MIDPLSIATYGYLRTPKALQVATYGYLPFDAVVDVPRKKGGLGRAVEDRRLRDDDEAIMQAIMKFMSEVIR